MVSERQYRDLVLVMRERDTARAAAAELVAAVEAFLAAPVRDPLPREHLRRALARHREASGD